MAEKINERQRFAREYGVVRETITMKDVVSEGTLLRHIGYMLKAFELNRVMWDMDIPTAYINGRTREVHINPYVSFDTALTVNQQCRIVKGLPLHEAGHYLYTPMESHGSHCESLANGTVPFATDSSYTAQDLANLSEIKARETGWNYLAQMFHQFWNICEDSFIEPAIISEYPGFAPDLEFLRDVHASEAPFVDDIEDAIEDDKKAEQLFPAFCSVLLFYAKFGILWYKKEGELIRWIREIDPILDGAILSTDGSERENKSWHIFVRIWPLLRDTANMQALMEQVAEALSQYGAAPSETNSGSNGNGKKSEKKSFGGQKQLSPSTSKSGKQRQQVRLKMNKSDAQDRDKNSKSASDADSNKEGESKSRSKTSAQSAETESKNSGNGKGEKAEPDNKAETKSDSSASGSEYGPDAKSSSASDSNGDADGSEQKASEAGEPEVGNSSSSNDFGGDSESSSNGSFKSESNSESNSKSGSVSGEGMDSFGSESNETDCEISSRLEGDSVQTKSCYDEAGRLNVASNCEDGDGNGEIVKADDSFSFPDNEIEDLLDRIAETIARENITSNQENERISELQREVKSLPYTSCHDNVNIKLLRLKANEITPSMIAAYNKLLSTPEIKQTKNALKRKFQSLFLAPESGIREVSGTRLAKGRFANEETTGKIFLRKQTDAPTIAVAVCVDESGSMSGNLRVDHARKFAIILQAVCEELNIPVLIVGHTESNSVELRSYSEFDKIDKLDKYRLMSLSARSCNRDGAALYYVAHRLAQRPEQIKLLFSISDGQPNGRGYGGEKAEKDIHHIVSYFKRKGVTTFAAAIGDDKEKIRKCYGGGFLDVTDMKKLPAMVYNIIRASMK